MSAFVLTHPEQGVYLGEGMGFAFWSKEDPVGQPSAPTWPSADAARAYVESWDQHEGQLRFDALTLVEVVPDVMAYGFPYASMAACVRAGLEPWLDEYAQTEGSA